MPVVLKKSGRKIATQVEWMRTASERTRGMLKFDQPPENYAAIFLLPMRGFFPLIHTIGMKFAIDLLFCSKDGKVLDRKLNLKPFRFAIPFQNILGGAEVLIEFSGCNLADVEVGDIISWEESHPS